VAAAIILPLFVSAPTAQAFSPCQGYCVNIQNMYWSLNTNVKIGIYDGPITGPAQVTTYDFSWYRVYAYQAQAPYGCNF
jgi:hypothetical protein